MPAIRLFFVVVCGLCCCPALTWGREPLRLRNDRAELVISPEGGTITGFRLKGKPLNPLNWEVPDDFESQSETKPAPRGHFLCLDRWGAPSAAEGKRGMPFHGEAAVRAWQLTTPPEGTPAGVRTVMTVELPLAQLFVTREVTLEAGGVARVSETVTNRGPLGRLYNMVQHPTIAPPFLDEHTLVDSCATRGFCQDSPTADRDEGSWPRMGLPGGTQVVDLRHLEVEAQSGVKSDVTSFVFDEGVEWGWVTAAQPAQGLLLGYAWRTADYPWLNIWRFRDGMKRLARGLEFGTTGIHRPPAELLKQGGQRFGRPTFAYLEPDESVTRDFLMFLVEIPRDFAGVRTVDITPAGLRLQERREQSPRTVDVSASREALQGQRGS
ncbi:MAG: hypothetical protein ACK50P_07860 [Planctomycetaceae bacterium]